jgi:transposase
MDLPTFGGRSSGSDSIRAKEHAMAKRRFTREFKLSAVKLVNEQGYSLTEAAKSLGIDPANVRDWVRKLSVTDGLVPTGEGALKAELRRLRKENMRLMMEQEILKKAAAFFAREQR